MNTLKSAFGKQEKNNDKISSNISKSMNRFNQNKSSSMWAFEGQENDQVSLDADKKLQILNNLLKSTYQKDKNLTNLIFDRIAQDFEDQIGSTSRKSQISYFLVLQDKTTDLLQLYSKSNPQFRVYLEKFHEKVQDKIGYLRSKDKSTNLVDYDKIVNKNFKKKTQNDNHLDIQAAKIEVNTKSKDKSQSKKKSNEKKLNRLFSKEKGIKEKQIKKQQQHDDYLLSETMVDQNNGSVSYSAIMSTSVAVKQRRPRKKSGQYNDHYMSKTQTKQVKTVENEEQGGDQAFIFYRPKKGKK